jgi:hypothetical protein
MSKVPAMIKIKLCLLFSSALLLLSGCHNKNNTGEAAYPARSEAQRDATYKMGGVGIGDGYRYSQEDQMHSFGTRYSDSDALLRAYALKKDSAYLNSEYAEALYNRAILKPKNSYTRKILLDEAETRLEIASRNYLKLDFVYGVANLKGREYQNSPDNSNPFDSLHKKIKSAQAEK